MNIDVYSDRAKQAIQSAQSLALARGHQQLAPEHLLKVLLEEKDGLSRALIQSAGGRPDEADKAVDTLLGKLPKVEGGSGQLYMKAETARVFEKAAAENAKAVVVSAAIESEIATLPPDERDAFLADLGLHETGLARVIRAGYELLGLITFFTAGPKEARAWTVHKGAKAPEAAGEIHTDFERGFIRAETIAYDDYVRFGGEAGARDAGKLRSEGKDYVVQDGDVLLFRFNV